MTPLKSPLQLTVPPTLEKKLEALAALRTLQAQDEELVRQRRAAIAALRRDVAELQRDFPAFCRQLEIELAELRRLLKGNPDQLRVPIEANADGSADLPASARAAKEQSMAEASSAYRKAAADDPEHPGWPAGAPDGKGGQFRPKDGDRAESPVDSKGPSEGSAKPGVQYAALETGTQTDASRAPNGNGSSSGAEPGAVAQRQPERGPRATALEAGTPTDATEGAPHFAVSAVVPDRTTVIYTNDDGSQDVYSGGSISWRNNNPGNMVAGAGGIHPIGRNGGFAIFPDYQTGFNAMVANLQTADYQVLTVGQAIAKWAPVQGGNDPVTYANHIQTWSGLPPDMPMDVLSTAQINALALAIQRQEGYVRGTITHTPPPPNR